jgi:hypothetical protein
MRACGEASRSPTVPSTQKCKSKVKTQKSKIKTATQKNQASQCDVFDVDLLNSFLTSAFLAVSVFDFAPTWSFLFTFDF